MSKLRNICLSEKNSTLQTSLFHETERPTFKNPFSWQTVANVLNSLPMGVCECENLEDAKGYTKVLIVLIAVFLLAGLEGGAL